MTVLSCALLAGCATTVALEPAAHATNPACAAVVVRLPDTVADLAQHDTNAQGTGAWGSPTSVILHCGVPVPGPSTLPCVGVGDVYWLLDNSKAPTLVYTTYGRNPATQVVVNQDKASGGVVLLALQDAVDYTAKTGHKCTSLEDTLEPDPSIVPTPTASATPSPTPSPTPSN
jgi:Protein of unknown function (DUF3515)